MLQLLQPAWLFSLAGLSVPVIIHFWNLRPGKILKVGSIALVAENEKQYKRRIQLSDWLLLVLRCLLITLVAFAMSKPAWRSNITTGREKGWVLISNENAIATYNQFKPVIDSLIKAGFVFHSFEEGFPKTSPEEIMKRAGSINTKSISYRALIASLDEQKQPAFPLYLFTDNYLGHFSGTRPAVSLNLHWVTYTPVDTGNLRTQPVKNDTSAFNITIFTDKYKNDVRYLKAAINAIQPFSKKNIHLTIANNVREIPATQDWLFWLSDTPMPSYVSAKHILLYESGRIKKTVSWINWSGMNAVPVPLFQSIAVTDTTVAFAENIWRDGFGNPVLSAEQNDSNHFYYHCYTHFDPAWSELPWSSSFPEMIYQLLEQNDTKAMQQDKRIIDSRQLLPAFITGRGLKNQPDLFTTTEIASLFWLAVGIVFLIERMVSFRYQKIKGNG